MRKPKTIIFICFIIIFTILSLSCLYVAVANKQAQDRPIEQINSPIFAIISKNALEKKELKNEPLICWGKVGILYAGTLAFPSYDEAQKYMLRHRKAFPLNKFRVLQLNGDYDLDATPLEHKPKIRTTNKPLSVRETNK